MRMRIMERQEALGRDRTLWETSGEGGAAKLGFAQRAGEQANDLNLKGEVSKATNPELIAAKEAEADAELQRKIKAGKALLPLEIERASKLAAADAGTRARYREKPQTMGEKAAELETFLGRKLLPEERERLSGLAKGRDPETGLETVVEKQFDAQGNETGSITRRVPIKAGQGGGREPAADPYAVPKRDGAPAAKPGAASPKPAAAPAPAGPGMLASLREAVSGAMGEGAKTGNAIEALRAKVKSGAPLTPQETQMARKYGMGV
jgi:hypothetical protein